MHCNTQSMFHTYTRRWRPTLTQRLRTLAKCFIFVTCSLEYDSEDEDTLSSQLEESFSDVLSNESREEGSQPLNIKLPAKRKPNHEPSPSKKHHVLESFAFVTQIVLGARKARKSRECRQGRSRNSSSVYNQAKAAAVPQRNAFQTLKRCSMYVFISFGLDALSKRPTRSRTSPKSAF